VVKPALPAGNYIIEHPWGWYLHTANGQKDFLTIDRILLQQTCSLTGFAGERSSRWHVPYPQGPTRQQVPTL
jgi:hypothetical protein